MSSDRKVERAEKKQRSMVLAKKLADRAAIFDLMFKQPESTKAGKKERKEVFIVDDMKDASMKKYVKPVALSGRHYQISPLFSWQTVASLPGFIICAQCEGTAFVNRDKSPIPCETCKAHGMLLSY